MLLMLWLTTITFYLLNIVDFSVQTKIESRIENIEGLWDHEVKCYDAFTYQIYCILSNGRWPQRWCSMVCEYNQPSTKDMKILITACAPTLSNNTVACAQPHISSHTKIMSQYYIATFSFKIKPITRVNRPVEHHIVIFPSHS